MCDVIATLTLETLRVLGAEFAEMRTEQREQRGRLGAIEVSLARVRRGGAEGRAETGGRFDRVLDRLERMERRLELEG